MSAEHKISGGPETITVSIHPEDIEYARQYSSQSAKFDHHAFFIGKLGERCAIRYLRGMNIALAEDWTEVNRADQYDMATTGDIFDVKTTSKPHNNRLLVSKDKFDRGRKFSFYVAVRLSQDLSKAEICGYAAMRDVENAGVMEINGRKVYWISYSDLRPFSELAEYMKKFSTRTI